MEHRLNKISLEKIKPFIVKKQDGELINELKDFHHADIAEMMNFLEFQESLYVFSLIDRQRSAEILKDLDDELREKFLEKLSVKEIAEEIDELNTDDAADIIAELPKEKKDQVISSIEDVEHAKDIVDLLRYDSDTAGGLMAKELVCVKEHWNVLTCVKEMRMQAEHVARVHSIYVVDQQDRLKGRLSLKDLLTTSTKTPIEKVYIPKVIYVTADTKDTEVARIMQKYDLEAIPVVDELERLIGRITIDDIVDVIKEEADKDYQMAAGLSQDVEVNDSILALTKARLPWLILALIGGFISVKILGVFDGALKDHAELFFFTPLIAAMAGNVGVQSSAIVVQGLANNSITGTIWQRLLKELSLSLLNGIILGGVLMLGSHFVLGFGSLTAFTVTVSLITVIVLASLIGTFVPYTLNRYGIDPALATGPFITTSNDIFGLLIFFTIAKHMIGF